MRRWRLDALGSDSVGQSRHAAGAARVGSKGAWVGWDGDPLAVAPKWLESATPNQGRPNARERPRLSARNEVLTVGMVR
jgi:hypothetical protein